MTDFDYRPREGFGICWVLTVTGYDPEIDGDELDLAELSEIETAIEHMTWDYAAGTGAQLTRIHGAHGQRTYEWDDGAVHRYEWHHELVDLRCDICKSPDNDMYMLHDTLWDASGLDGRPCFRCFETAIGRQLVPADFKPGIPAHSEDSVMSPELCARMGLTGAPSDGR